jgi:hypothetical protein
MSVSVDPVDGIFLARAFAHILKKILKPLPTAADPDSAAAIVVKLFVCRL